MRALGNHILVEFHGCSAEILNDVPHIEANMNAAAKESGATIISSMFHHFSPFGVSGVVVIQESHLAIHTWPEYCYAAVDLFTCGHSINPWLSYEFLKTAFHAEQGSAIEINRGPLVLWQARNEGKIPTGFSPQNKTDAVLDLLDNSNVELGDLRDRATQKLVPPKHSRSVWVTNGKILPLDQREMCSEKDERAYHEMLIHVPMVVNPDVQRVLVIGGGDGGSVRELMRYPHVEQVTMVKIDEGVVRAREFLPSLSGALNHPKLDLRIEDGLDYVKNAASEQFDLIVIDSSNPVGLSAGLFSQSFYQEAYRCLAQGGTLTTRGESPHLNQSSFVALNQCLKRVFNPEDVWCYLAFIPAYPTGMWSFNYCSKGGRHPLKEIDKGRSRQLSQAFDLQYYNADIHHAAFCLPTFIKNMLA